MAPSQRGCVAATSAPSRLGMMIGPCVMESWTQAGAFIPNAFDSVMGDGKHGNVTENRAARRLALLYMIMSFIIYKRCGNVPAGKPRFGGLMSPKPDDWKDEAYQAYVAKWRAHEAAESERRRQEGKIAIWLERGPDR